MSALEVLQSCPTQRKALLKAIGGIDPTDTNLIIFDLEDHIPRLPPQLTFQIQVVVSDKNICRTVIDEGASTCVMSIACWKAIGSPPLTESHNTLKAFNGSSFKPYGVLPSLPITLEGKQSTLKLRSLTLLSITTFYLVVAGSIPCVQLCLLFSASCIFHIREK
jgi:hypothetical protein